MKTYSAKNGATTAHNFSTQQDANEALKVFAMTAQEMPVEDKFPNAHDFCEVTTDEERPGVFLRKRYKGKEAKR